MTKTRDLANLIADSKVGPTEIDTSGTYTLGGIAATGNLTLDVAGYLDIDADDGGVYFSDGGTTFGRIYNDSSNLRIKSQVNDKDIVFQGVDNSSTITALTLDMSEGGAATFSGTVTSTGLIGNATNFDIIQNTSDGSDSKRTRIGGGGDVVSSRGAMVEMSGNEHGNGGMLFLHAGNGGAYSQIRSYTAGTERMRIDSSGNVVINTGNLQIKTIGQIEDNGTRLLLRSTGDASGLRFDGGGYTPFKNGSAANGTVDLGFSGGQFKDLYLSNIAYVGAGVYLAGHPVVGVASFDSGYATRLGSTGSSTVNATQIYAGGSVQATFKGGNVGIGTTSPNNKLDVNGGIVCSPNTDGKDTFELSTNASDEGRLRIKNVDTTTVQIRAGGDSYFNGGNVGIGTTSPDNPLEVVGADSGIKISSGSSNRPHLRFECGSDEKLRLSSNTVYGAIGDGSDANRYMGFKNGYVGIGTINPEYQLEVFKATGNLGKFTTTDDNNGATNTLSISYNASLRVDNAYSGAGPSAHGTKVAKIQLGTVTTNGYGAYGAIIVDSHNTGYDTAEMSFATGSNSSNLMTERMRINKDGKVGIGTSSPDCMLHLSGGNEEAKIKFQVGTANADKFKIYASTAGRLYVNSDNGSTGVYLTHNGTSWTSNSDETLKDNITSLGTVGDKLKNYRTSYFNWKADTDTPPKRHIGFIAQDWETDFPEVVTKKEGETLGMQYTETIPILLKYIQELEARITALEA